MYKNIFFFIYYYLLINLKNEYNLNNIKLITC